MNTDAQRSTPADAAAPTRPLEITDVQGLKERAGVRRSRRYLPGQHPRRLRYPILRPAPLRRGRRARCALTWRGA